MALRRLLAGAVVTALLLGGVTGIAKAETTPPTPADPPLSSADENKPVSSKDEENKLDQPIKVIVMMKSQPRGKGNETQGRGLAEAMGSRLKGAGLNVDRSFGYLVNGVSGWVKPSDIAKLRADSDVASVREVRMFYPTMESAAKLTQSVQARENYGLDGRGLVVSVIDTGIDMKHQDLRLDDDALASIKLQPESGFTAKVPYGYNFADKNTTLVDVDSQHGQHVSGIVAANGGKDASIVGNGRINGVAPNAQLLAMKVFSNDPGRHGAAEDDIIAAIEESVKRGADIINMSLGSPNGPDDPDTPQSRAIINAQAAGVQVIVAAGNEGLSTSSDMSTVDRFGTLDNGAVDAPGTSPGALSIASVENSALVYTTAKATWAGGEKTVVYQWQNGARDGQPHVLVNCGEGLPENVPAEAKGQFCLIERGKISFGEKFKNAVDKGATGVVVFNHAAGGDSLMRMGGIEGATPGAFLYHSDGKALADQLSKGKVEIVFTDAKQLGPNPESMQPSSFTSWGATQNLDFKPQLAGIGGNVYSTMNGNGYDTMSGTSMATPHIAGVFALAVQEYQRRFPNLDAVTRNQLLRTALSNTAKILQHDAVPYAPRQMGAGLAQTKDALATSVFVTSDGAPEIPLRQLDGARQFTVVLENKGDRERTFKPGATCVVNEVQELNKPITTTCSAKDKIQVPGETIKVPAGGKTEVGVEITPDMAARHWVEGWVTFTSDDAAQPSLSIPYLGFAGDWNAEKIMDTPVYEETKDNPSLMSKIFGEKNRNRTVLFSSYPFLGAVERGPGWNWISPNGDKVFDEIIPAAMMLRNARTMRYEVLDDKKNVIKDLGIENSVRRMIMSKMPASGSTAANQAFDNTWDGTVYDAATGKDKPSPDGKYFIRISAQLGEGFDWQTVELPFGVDRVAPQAAWQRSAQADGSVTYAFHLYDDRSGILPSSIKAEDETVVTEFKGEWKDDTYTVTVPDPDKHKYIHLQFQDMAGNKAEAFDFFGSTGVKFVQPQLDRFVGKDTADWDTRAPFVREDGTIPVRGQAVMAAKVKLNGTEIELRKDGSFETAYKLAEGRNELNLVGYDAQGNEIGKDHSWVGFDTTAPKFDEINAPRDEQGRLKLDAEGKAVITGKVSDEFSKPDKEEYQLVLAAGSNLAEIKPDGTFTLTAQPAATDQTVNLVLWEKGPQDLHAVNYTIENLLLVRPASTGSALSIAFDDPALQPHQVEGEPPQRFGKTTYFLNQSFQNLTKTDNGARLVLKGVFNRVPKEFSIDGAVVPVAENGRFEVAVDLEEGVTKVAYKVVDGDKVDMESAWRFVYDESAPQFEVTDPSIGPDQTIYVNKAEQTVAMRGSVWDNALGYKFAINGDVVAQTEAGTSAPKYNKRDFSKELMLKDGTVVRIDALDSLGNGLSYKLPVVLDDKEPTVTFDGRKKAVQTKPITIKGSDDHLMDMMINVDGKQVDYQKTPTMLSASVAKVRNNQVGTEEKSSDEPNVTELSYILPVAGLSRGYHRIEVIVRDRAGNTKVETIQIMVRNCKPLSGPTEITASSAADALAKIKAGFQVEEGQLEIDVATLIPGETNQVAVTWKSGAEIIETQTVKVKLAEVQKPTFVPAELEQVVSASEVGADM